MNDESTDAAELLPKHEEVAVIESIERAQIDMQIATAKKYPRNMPVVKREIESLATMDQETAEACFYSLPRGGKTIQGPGVRMAEIALHCFGNARVQTRIIDAVTSGNSPHVTVQAVCADLEKNIAVSIEKRRRIVGKKLYVDGKPAGNKPPDEDDINLATNAGSAIAFRDAVFKVIPGAMIKPAYEAAKKVAIGNAQTLAQRRVQAVERFAKMGVDLPRVLNAIGKKHIESIDLSDLETLFGLFTAIKDGQTSIDDAFPAIVKPAAGEPGAAAEPEGKRLPRLQDGKSVASGRPAATIPPKHTPQEEPPAQDPEPTGEGKPEVVDQQPGEREPGADEDDLPYEDPKATGSAAAEHEPERPAVKGGLTGATRPLGAAAGPKKRTLANPE